jgi:hypothetical protein
MFQQRLKHVLYAQFVTRKYEVQSFLLHSYSFCSCMLRLLHHISVFSRLVVQRAFASPSLAFQRSSQSERIYTCPRYYTLNMWLVK